MPGSLSSRKCCLEEAVQEVCHDLWHVVAECACVGRRRSVFSSLLKILVPPRNPDRAPTGKPVGSKRKNAWRGGSWKISRFWGGCLNPQPVHLGPIFSDRMRHTMHGHRCLWRCLKVRNCLWLEISSTSQNECEDCGLRRNDDQLSNLEAFRSCLTASTATATCPSYSDNSKPFRMSFDDGSIIRATSNRLRPNLDANQLYSTDFIKPPYATKMMHDSKLEPFMKPNWKRSETESESNK